MAKRKRQEAKQDSRRFRDLDDFRARYRPDADPGAFKNDLEVLFYTFVNRRATEPRMLADIHEALMLPFEDIMRIMNRLIDTGLIKAVPKARGDTAAYVNTIYIEDIIGLEEYKTVNYYLRRNRKVLISKSEEELAMEEHV